MLATSLTPNSPQDLPIWARLALTDQGIPLWRVTHWIRGGDGGRTIAAGIHQADRPVYLIKTWQPSNPPAAPAICRCDEPDADPYQCEADDCHGHFTELSPPTPPRTCAEPSCHQPAAPRSSYCSWVCRNSDNPDD